MDFSDRKCCEDGLGNKKRSGFYLKMCVQLILNLSVFSLFCVFLRGNSTAKKLAAGPEHVTDRIGGFYLSE